jgi:signal transduction histidine kinase
MSASWAGVCWSPRRINVLAGSSARAATQRSTLRCLNARAAAARSDVPVELVIDLPERLSAAIETIAYFCAAELLTNVAKHSGARHATLEVVYVPGLLRVRVSDDGVFLVQAAPSA